MRYFIYVQFGKSNDPHIHVVEVTEKHFFEYIDFVSSYFTISKEDDWVELFGCEVTHYNYGDDEYSAIASAGYIVWGNCSKPQ